MKKCKNKYFGGPERRAYNRDNVTPVSFREGDPFWDIGAEFSSIESDIRSNELCDIVIVKRFYDNDVIYLDYYSRGTEPNTTTIGMLEWAKNKILREQED